MTVFDFDLSTGMILIDLQKAFDTINHEILLKKCTFLDFLNQSINCFESCLSNRSFWVNIQSKYSSIAKFDCRVSQGIHITQWHTLAAHWIKIYLQSLRPSKLLRKLTADSDFCRGKISFYLSLFPDYFVTFNTVPFRLRVVILVS